MVITGVGIPESGQNHAAVHRQPVYITNKTAKNGLVTKHSERLIVPAFEVECPGERCYEESDGTGHNR